MQAIVKGENKILINGADYSEKILIENLIEAGNSANKETKYESVLDINGEVTGCMITILDKVVEEISEEQA